MKRIAVLMTCYNRVKVTLECLRRLYEQKFPDGYSLDVWLVDDASPDQTGVKVKTSFPRVNVIEGSGSLFWCKGMRLAWDKAAENYDYDFYLWLNDDVKLNEDALAKLLRGYGMVAGESIICGSVLDPKTGAIFYGGRGIKFSDGVSPVIVERGMHGNVVLVPKVVFDRIGGMAKGLVHQHGDFEYGFRARKNGIIIYAIPSVGTCEANYGFDKRSLLQMKVGERFKALFSPKQIGLLDYCRYKYLTVGAVGCVLSYIKGLLTALMPKVMQNCRGKTK